MESGGSSAGKAVPQEVLQQMRQAVPNDGLNPDAHLDFAKALISSLGCEFCQNRANWLDTRYIEAHYHASVACALKRANKMGGRHQGMGHGQDAPGSVPAAVKEAFANLGDDGGWKRVIFCTSKTALCSWLKADAAATALTSPTLEKKKATFVLLNGSYPLTLSLSNCQIDLYGIVDQHKKVELLASDVSTLLQVKDASRLRLCNLCIKRDSSQSHSEQPLVCLAGASCASMSQIHHVQDLAGAAVEAIDSSTFVVMHGCNLTSFSDSTKKTMAQVVVKHGAAGIIGIGATTTTDIKFAGQPGNAWQPRQEPAIWRPPIINASCQTEESREAFFAGVRQLAQASVGSGPLGSLSKYLKGSSIVLCGTDAELDAALCCEGAPAVIVCLTKSGLTISQPLRVKEAVILGMVSLSGNCEMIIGLQTDNCSVHFDSGSAMLEIHYQNMTAALTMIDVDVKIKSTSTPEFLRGFERLMVGAGLTADDFARP